MVGQTFTAYADVVTPLGAVQNHQALLVGSGTQDVVGLAISYNAPSYLVAGWYDGRPVAQRVSAAGAVLDASAIVLEPTGVSAITPPPSIRTAPTGWSPGTTTPPGPSR